MNKTQVYSWRLNADLKRRLEEAAREEGSNVAVLLERIARDWLGAKRTDEDEEARQQRLHAEVAKSIGAISLSEGPYTRTRIRERARASVQERRRRHGTPRPD